jgi:hypothetical protein
MALVPFEVEGGLSIEGILFLKGAGSPESVLTAPIGSFYTNTVNGDTYKKTSGASNTGWENQSSAASVNTQQDTFMGRGTGESLPTYSSITRVLVNDPLDTALGKLDASIGANASPVARTFNPIIAIDPVNTNLDKLDTAIGADVTPSVRTQNPISMAQSLLANLAALDKAVGTDAQMTSVQYIALAQSIHENLSDLDFKLKSVSDIVDGFSTGQKWRPEQVAAVTDDADLQSATSGAALSTLLPFSDDEAPAMVIGDFAANTYLLSRNTSGTDRLWKIYDDAGTLKITTTGFTALAKGDTFMVEKDLIDSPAGDETESIYTYNGTDLVKIGDVDWSIATGINLSAGYTATVATSSGLPANNESIEAAIAKLHKALSDAVTASGIALNAQNLGTFTGTIIPDNTTFKAAMQALETDLDAVQTLTGVAAEAIVLGGFTGGLLGSSLSIKAAIQALETHLVKERVEATAGAVTTQTSIDTVLVDNFDLIIWEVVATAVATPSAKETVTVKAIHNGTTSADATNVDRAIYSKVRIGSNIAGLNFDVGLSGAGAAQVVQLLVTSTDSVNVKSIRRVR